MPLRNLDNIRPSLPCMAVRASRTTTVGRASDTKIGASGCLGSVSSCCFPTASGRAVWALNAKSVIGRCAPSHERVDDALASLAYLATQANVRPQAIFLLGWSNGGSTVLYSVEPKHAPRSGVDFAKAVAFYPGCRVPLETGQWKTRITAAHFDRNGGRLDGCGPLRRSCSTAAKSNSLPVDIVTYPNAYHDFDHPNLPIHTIDGLAFTASGTGHVHTGTDRCRSRGRNHACTDVSCAITIRWASSEDDRELRRHSRL